MLCADQLHLAVAANYDGILYPKTLIACLLNCRKLKLVLQEFIRLRQQQLDIVEMQFCNGALRVVNVKRADSAENEQDVEGVTCRRHRHL